MAKQLPRNHSSPPKNKRESSEKLLLYLTFPALNPKSLFRYPENLIRFSPTPSNLQPSVKPILAEIPTFLTSPHSPSLSITQTPMDRHDGQTSSARPSLKRKLEPEFQDQNQAHKILVVQDPNKDVQSSSTLPSSSESHWDHDVFLSFRGEDTRKNFTDHLYSALVRVGIRTFRDDEELPRGKTISTELLSAIRGSRISIVIFSKGYASSSWCLDELVEIVRCRETTCHTLLPIFYNVDPSDVRKQIKTFAEAFVRHEDLFQADIERVKSWRAALTKAADCSGWDLKSVANGDRKQWRLSS